MGTPDIEQFLFFDDLPEEFIIKEVRDIEIENMENIPTI
jgi:hypothetical protein